MNIIDRLLRACATVGCRALINVPRAFPSSAQPSKRIRNIWDK
jgi:hypothetical protein